MYNISYTYHITLSFIFEFISNCFGLQYLLITTVYIHAHIRILSYSELKCIVFFYLAFGFVMFVYVLISCFFFKSTLNLTTLLTLADISMFRKVVHVNKQCKNPVFIFFWVHVIKLRLDIQPHTIVTTPLRHRNNVKNILNTHSNKQSRQNQTIHNHIKSFCYYLDESL